MNEPRIHAASYELDGGTLCKIAGNWEPATTDRNKMTCELCLGILSEPQPKTEFFTMLQRNIETGEEIVIYPKTTGNVIAQYVTAWVGGEGREVVVRSCPSTYKCDYRLCPGSHPHPDAWCSATRRIEDYERGL